MFFRDFSGVIFDRASGVATLSDDVNALLGRYPDVVVQLFYCNSLGRHYFSVRASTIVTALHAHS
jgi:hypothetical protein